jgi:cytochrome c oxidase subunit 1
MATQVDTLPRIWAPRSKFLEWVLTTNHKRIGILYLSSSMVFFIVGGLEALLIRIQLAQPNGTLLTADQYNQVFTMHGTTMVFLVAMPLAVGFGNYIIPLLIGARDVAFPRLNALSFWLFIFGGLFMYSSFLFGGAPDAGWFAYAPLTEKAYNIGSRMDFWSLGVVLLALSSTVGAINFIVTDLQLRAPGMSLSRTPMFVWTNFVTSFIAVFALPALLTGVVMLFLDRQIGTHFFIPQQGGNALLWQQLFWFFGHPEVYILILPAMGIISEVVPVFSRKPLFGYMTVAFSTVAIGVISFTVWAHHMFATGLSNMALYFYSADSFLIGVPTGVKIFAWLGTMWGGKLRFKTPMLMAIGFVSMFLIGGITGIHVAIVPIDWQVTDTYYVVSHMHYVLFGGAIFGLFAGAYYWFPKMTGRMLNERLGKVHFWLMLVGMNMVFMPMAFLGLDGMPRRIYTYPAEFGWGFWNLISSIGGFVVALSVLFFLINLYVTLRQPADAGDDPWDGFTLEWTVSSPPPVHNFDEIPTVHSRRPLWDLKHPDLADWKQGK